MNFPDFENEEKILFNVEDVDFTLFDDTHYQQRIIDWIERVTHQENKTVGNISYIFCSDDFLHKLNMEYLNHDTLTDIITFPYNIDPIEGDIFISIDRVADNAKDFGFTFEVELQRVIIHGILHLCGYRDETDEEEALMRKKENVALIQLK
ncbi:MAG: rRNA maturation RNase YbeY [Saprospiraceae bacterium]|nr:rRNA maturation RNase YbeY [Saprospiraceae bacterium]